MAAINQNNSDKKILQRGEYTIVTQKILLRGEDVRRSPGGPMKKAAQPGPKLRMINDVLVEPGSKMAPTKRRRRKAKRQIEDDRLGNIREYLFKI